MSGKKTVKVAPHSQSLLPGSQIVASRALSAGSLLQLVCNVSIIRLSVMLGPYIRLHTEREKTMLSAAPRWTFSPLTVDLGL